MKASDSPLRDPRVSDQDGRRLAPSPEAIASDHRDDAGNPLLVLILFWWALIAGIAVWWFDTPDRSITSAGAALTAVGRITGMIGGFVLIIQILMMSRVAWLEAWIGAHDLLRWHRKMGAYLFVMVIAHVVFIIVGYARTDRVSITGETWSMLTTFEDMISASVATGILVAVSVLAIRAIRRRMRYEVWHVLHLSGYLVLLLSYGHQFADGADLSRPGLAHWYWGGLYAVVVACLVWGRAVEPLWLNLRHRLRVVEVVPESEDMFSVHIGGRHLDRMDVRPGQYLRWRFLTVEGLWQSHPFSLSAAPSSRSLRLTINAVGGHTADLQYLRPGTWVIAVGPYGTFTADRRIQQGTLLIAGGSGIAPVRALLEEMPAGTVVIYRASTAADLVFRRELDSLAGQRGLRVVYVLGSRHDPGPRHLFTPDGMRDLVPDVARRDVYLCGPEGLISVAVKTLHRLKVPRRQIHLDPFEF
ncbi:MAG: oxidoreductase [Actinomycetia bacterium]|nr:oxidoreductase [Actinomycetes bacterium]